MTRTQKRNRRRKEKRRENEEQKTRAKEQGPCFFTIHESDSEEWHSVCSELGYEDALSLHGGDSDDESSEEPGEDVAERHADCVEALLLKKGTKAQKRNMAQTQRFRQERELPVVEQMGLEFGELRLIHTQNDLHYLGTEKHPPIVEAAREGNVNGIRATLDRDKGTVSDRRMRKEINERNGYDKVWVWQDDTALIAAARSGHSRGRTSRSLRRRVRLVRVCSSVWRNTWRSCGGMWAPR